ncbi:MAG TPA: D-2-hydroxyacid dehydrogenase [Opitutus sp.]|nr:D-2-hydroxyacid dehydrogenase [Opitutus sp.]
MKPAVVLAADQLDDATAADVAAACAGWTSSYQRVPQTMNRDDIAALLDVTDILVGWTDPMLLRESRVSTYLCGSAGFDAYVGVGLDRKVGFRLTNAAGVMAGTIAEHCLALMFALVRELPTILDQQRRRHYERRWQAREVAGATACIVGLGVAGTALAQRCRALGMRTTGVCRAPDSHRGVTDVLHQIDSLSEAVCDADHVFSLLPGGAATRHVFDARIFTNMKRGACYYAAGRGSVTDQAALIDALAEGRLGGAGIDVFAHEPLHEASPLWTMPNVIVSPHSAGLSMSLNGRLAALFVDNLDRLRSAQPLRNEIAPSQLV